MTVNEFLEKASNVSIDDIQRISIEAERNNRIPKIIHMCFFNWEELTTKEPEYIPLLETWINNLSDYTFINWNRNNLPINHFCEVALNSRLWAFGADYARIYGLYNYGGIWMDCDVAVYKAFDDLLDLPYILDCEHSMFVTMDKRPRIEAAIMGSRRHWDFWKPILDYYNNFNGSSINVSALCLPFHINNIAASNGYKILYNYGDIAKYREYFNTQYDYKTLITLDSTYLSKTEMDFKYKAINMRNITVHHEPHAYTSHQLFDKWC